MRNWLLTALRRAQPALGEMLPQEMWAGYSPLDYGVVSWRAWRLGKRSAA
ncbi:MAG: hypothetical protein ACRD3I_12775 [Terriglobales bacterium]